jgi:hypothetical protein
MTTGEDGEMRAQELVRRARELEKGESDNPLRVAAANKLYKEARALREGQITRFSTYTMREIEELVKENERLRTQDEQVREAMFILSDRLRASGILSASDLVHEAYEAVVAVLTEESPMTEMREPKL